MLCFLDRKKVCNLILLWSYFRPRMKNYSAKNFPLAVAPFASEFGTDNKQSMLNRTKPKQPHHTSSLQVYACALNTRLNEFRMMDFRQWTLHADTSYWFKLKNFSAQPHNLDFDCWFDENAIFGSMIKCVLKFMAAKLSSISKRCVFS